MSLILKRSLSLLTAFALAATLTVLFVPRALATRAPTTVSLSVSTSNVTQGKTVTFTAKVRHGAKGQKVVLQQLKAGTWKKVQSSKLAKRKKLRKVRFDAKAKTVGIATYRVKVKKKGTAAAAISKIKSVTVKRAAQKKIPNEPNVSIVDYGFGQRGNSATAVVIVTNNSRASVGQYVTATVNFMDTAGKVIATEDQVETFRWVGQHLVLPVWTYPIPAGATIAEIDPFVSISSYRFVESAPKPKLPILKSTSIVKEDYGDGFTANFSFTNKSSQALEDLRVGAVCYDTRGRINGGGSIYPPTVPPQRTIVFSSFLMEVSSRPAYCDGYLNYGY